jgi:hypothetical protein
LEPLQSKIPKSVHEKLHRALSIVYGIEPYIILKDIWGANDREVERTALWMADALVEAALREAKAPRESASGAVAPAGNHRAAQRATVKKSKPK